MDPFIKDITDVEEIPNVRMIDYKGKFCIVRKLKKDSAILKMNPTLKYLIRYPQGKSPTDNSLYAISYIPISKVEFDNGLKSYKKIMKGGYESKSKTKYKSKTR